MTRSRFERRDGLMVEYRKIDRETDRQRNGMLKQGEPEVTIKGICINKSDSGNALQINFVQHNIAKLWIPKKFCEVHADGTVIVRIPRSFRSRLDASQQVRMAKLIRCAVNQPT